SKLSANAGMTEMEFVAMQDSNPAAALKLLLAKKGSQGQTTNESKQSSSTASESELCAPLFDRIPCFLNFK
ncbi:hypothetical protein A2U01_0096816, partial [Trifolium medium]|nr:hypothetical protein [Trifolium medium]